MSALESRQELEPFEFQRLRQGADPLAPNGLAVEIDDPMHLRLRTLIEELALEVPVPGSELPLHVESHRLALKAPEKLEILTARRPNMDATRVGRNMQGIAFSSVYALSGYEADAIGGTKAKSHRRFVASDCEKTSGTEGFDGTPGGI